MYTRKKPQTYVGVGLTAFLVVAALMIFYRIISDLSGLGAAFGRLADVLQPFLVGAALAYLFAPLYQTVETAVHTWLERGSRLSDARARNIAKAFAAAAVLLLLVAVVGGLLGLALPQIYHSVVGLIETLPDKSAALHAWLDRAVGVFGEGSAVSDWVRRGLSAVTQGLTTWAQQELLPDLGNIAVRVSSGLLGVIGTVADVLIGVILCVYILSSRRLFAAQAKKMLYSLFSAASVNRMLEIVRFADATFGQFISGVLLEALAVGVVCFAGLSALHMPYALLLSVIVGLFNIVPIFGPVIGAIVGAFLILLENPVKAVVFVIFAVVLQQFDNHVLAPRILGQKTGLSGFWVIFSIVIGGGLFGLVGMILGVPTFAVIYVLIKQRVNARLQTKGLPDETEAFCGLREIDELTGEPKYGDDNG